MSTDGKFLVEKIDQYVELVAKLDEQIATLKNEVTAYDVTVQNLRLQLTDKDILLDQKIGKLHSIRALAENV